MKTIEDLSAANETLKPFVPEMHEDPNLDPRDGTEWAAVNSVTGDAGSQAEWHQYFEQTSGEGCFLKCGKPEEDPIHHNPRQAPFVEGDGCPPDCGHTVEEHEAFDAGVKFGERGQGNVMGCSLEGSLRDAWLTGYEVGKLNHAAELATNSDVVEDAPATDDAPDAPRVFSKEVEIALNDHDIAEKARKLSLLRVQIEELLAEKKKTDDGYKAKIGGLEEECAELFRAIRQGRETREEDVFERRDYDRKVVETVRANRVCRLCATSNSIIRAHCQNCGGTGELDGAVVETRPMKPTEYQLPLVSI